MDLLKDIITAIIMGTVEGLTEFAPVSSTGHMILVADLLDFHGVRASSFEVFIQLGSILAVCFVFKDRILNLLGLNKSAKFADETDENSSTGRLTLLHILCGMIPALIVGGLFSKFFKSLFSPTTVCITLVAGAILMIIAEGFRKPRAITTTVDQITYFQAFMVGCFQCLALFPGFSRSGSTISGGLLLGMNHKTASEYTFILAIPMMAAATTKDLWENIDKLGVSDIPLYAVGFLTAFVVALLAIKYFLKLISNIKLTPFAFYRIIVAAIFALFIVEW